MTRTRQDKTATTDAVELNDAALDGVAGGGESLSINFEKDVRRTTLKSTLTLIAD